MARGRIIVTEITRDVAVASLSDDTSRLALTWLMTFQDSEGRVHGDPAIVRSMVFPRREDVSVSQMRGYIEEWAAAGLVKWYQANGDLWISFPSFHKHQPGVDRRHEPESTIPPPPAPNPVQRTDTSSEVVQTQPVQRTDGGRTLPVQCTSEVKRSEEKGSEENHRGAQKTRAPQRTRDPGYLPDAEAQMGVLFSGPRKLRDPDDQLRAVNWDIRPEEVRTAACHFLQASGLSPPADKPTRGDWCRSLHQHMDNYGPAALQALYPKAVQHCRDQGLTLSRPGGLTNILPAIAAGTVGGKGNGANRYPDEPEYHIMSQADWDNAEVG